MPVYLDLYSFQKLKSDSLLILIHKFIIQESFKKIGWLFSHKYKYINFENANDVLPVSASKALGIVRKELKKQYSENKINQLKLMENFLLKKNLSTQNNEDNVIGINAFHAVWEKMCANYLNDQKSILTTSFYPAYRNSNGSEINPSLKTNSPKPDIIIFDDIGKIAIVDAKYYDLKKTKPGWSDLVKQFFYAKLFINNYVGHIENYFIVPKVGSIDMKKISVISDTLDNKSFLDNEFPPIKIFYIDVYEVMISYLNRKIGHFERKKILQGLT